jgi:hypothetical protein
MAGLLVVVMVSPPLRGFFALDLPRTVVLLAAVGIVAVTGTVMIFALRAVGWAKVVPELLREHPPTEPEAWRRLTRRVVEGSGWHRSFPTTTEMQPVVKPEPEGDE